MSSYHGSSDSQQPGNGQTDRRKDWADTGASVNGSLF